MSNKPGCNNALHYFGDEGEIWDWSIWCQMIKDQSTFLQPRKYDGLLLTSWKNGTAESRVAQVADNRNKNFLYLLDYPCRHRTKKAGFRWLTRKDFGDFRTANRRDAREAIGRSDLNIGWCSGPDVLDLSPNNVTKLCTMWIEERLVGSAGGDSMLLTLDHSARFEQQKKT